MCAFARVVESDAPASSECEGSSGAMSFRRPYVRATRRGGDAGGGESDIVDDDGGKDGER